MRIVAGRHRGRLLDPPAGNAIRPTSDRAREGLFNMLEHGGFAPGGASVVDDAVVLDAFCGTGALAFEALSRGAAAATLLDTSGAAVEAVRTTAKALGESGRITATVKDATAPGPAPRAHDLVFLDPPYASGPAMPALAAPALAALAAAGWIAPGAIVAIEIAAKAAPPELPPGFEPLRERRYGAARILLVRAP